MPGKIRVLKYKDIELSAQATESSARAASSTPWTLAC